MRFEKWIKGAGGRIRGVRKLAILGDEEDETEVSLNEEEEDPQEVVCLQLLKLSNMDQMNRVFGLLHSHPESIHFYLNDFIFPQYTRHQIIKLSESGQALGSDMLFPKPRIGFSGFSSFLCSLIFLSVIDDVNSFSRNSE